MNIERSREMSEIRASRRPRLKRWAVKRPYGDTILLYRLFSERHCHRSGSVYCLSVTKIENGGEKREVCTIRDIARDPYDAAKIFYLVSRGFVTPATAHEIVSDIISVYL